MAVYEGGLQFLVGLSGLLAERPTAENYPGAWFYATDVVPKDSRRPSRSNGSIRHYPEVVANVLSFGADPTGAADSSPAFKEAVAYANDKDLEAYVPDGTYATSEPLEIDCPTRIRGAGEGDARSGVKTVLRRPIGRLRKKCRTGIRVKATADGSEISHTALRSALTTNVSLGA
jgi:hypothetical protein